MSNILGGRKTNRNVELVFSPKKVISGKIYSESYYVYVNLKCRLALFRTRPNIYLSIDCRAKRLIFTGVWIVKFRNLIHVFFHIFFMYLFMYLFMYFPYTKNQDSQFTCTQRSSAQQLWRWDFPELSCFHRPCAHLDTTLEVERGIHRVPGGVGIGKTWGGDMMVVMWRFTDGVNAVKKHTYWYFTNMDVS